ncbi:MAG: hypothetical protein ABI831_06015 [Betaproteobacteria bacterium]
MLDLVRQAILAPSSHNTQCWRFQIAEKSISIAPDLKRRCPAVDPDDHHLFVSLGCATENMVHAALSASAPRKRFAPAMACSLAPRATPRCLGGWAAG